MEVGEVGMSEQRLYGGQVGSPFHKMVAKL
jgi:hypothetical protein